MAANTDWLTVVTLKITYQTMVWKPSFEIKLPMSKDSKSQCTCSRLASLYPRSTMRDLYNGLLPSHSFTARVVFTGTEKTEKAKRLCSPITGQNFESVSDFRLWILSLAVQLSHLCEMNHLPGAGSMRREVGLRPFKSAVLTPKTICEDLRRIISAPLRPSEKERHGMGYVYIIRNQIAPLTAGELKIGFSKFHPEHRAHELASCFARPEVIAHTPLLPHARRLESIVHGELQKYRKVFSCPRCGRDHQEWFTISHANSREVVTRWSKWILQRPYLDGDLTSAWKAYLATKNFDVVVDDDKPVAEIWQDIIQSFSPKQSADAGLKKGVAYLNECFWDVAIHEQALDLSRVMETQETGNESMSDFFSRMARKPFEEHSALVEQGFSDLRAKMDKHRGNGYKRDRAPAFDADVSRDTLMHDIVGANTPTGRTFHPSTTLGHLVDPGSMDESILDMLQHRQEDDRQAMDDLSDFSRSLSSIQTGAVSVSHPLLGITESPLGDATLLPVVACKDINHFDTPVANWVGINPTHAGFQYLQEAYQAGEWDGMFPRFKTPKWWCDAIPKMAPAEEIASEPRLKNSNGRSASNTTPISESYSKGRCTVRRDSNGIEITGSVDIERLKKIQKIIENGGRERVRKAAIKGLHQLGIDTGYDTSSDSEGDIDLDAIESEADDHDEMDLDEEPVIPTSLTQTEQLQDHPNLDVDFITPKMARKWFE